MSKKIKAIAISIGIFLGLTITAYAATALFYKTPKIGDPDDGTIVIKCNISDVPESLGEMASGDVRSMVPTITSASNVDMYVFIRAVMPKFGDGGLYEFENVGWSRVQAEEQDGQWVEVYRYDDILPPKSTTIPMCSGLKMVNMGLAQFAELTDFGVDFTAYACGTEDMGIDEAWDAVREHYGI